MGGVVSRALDVVVGGPPLAGRMTPPEPDEVEQGGRVATLQSSRLPHLGSTLLLVAAIKALLPRSVKDHPAAAAAVAAAVYGAWLLLPAVDDKALLKCEAKLLGNIKAQRNHRWTVLETRHGVWQVHSLHVAWSSGDVAGDDDPAAAPEQPGSGMTPRLSGRSAHSGASNDGSHATGGAAGTGSSTWGVRRSLTAGRSPRHRRRASAGSLHGETVLISPRSQGARARAQSSSSGIRRSRSAAARVPQRRGLSAGNVSAAASSAVDAAFGRGRVESEVAEAAAAIGVSPATLDASDLDLARATQSPASRGSITPVPEGVVAAPSPSDDDSSLCSDDSSVPDLPNLEQPPKGHIVILHGHSAGMGVWGKVVDGLQRTGYAFHLLDVPGWGRSVGPPELETTTDPDSVIDMYVTMFEAWREDHGLDKVTVLAHSLGAYLTSFWARRYPEHIDNVILVSPAGTFPVMPVDSWRASIAFKVFTPQRFSKLAGRLGLAAFRLANDWFSDDLDPDMVDYYYQLAASSKRLPGAGDRACAVFISYPAWNRSVWNRPAVGVLLGLRQHVTLVFGDNDPLVPAHFGALMQQLRPSGLNLFRLRDASHNPAHCRPSAFCEAIQHALMLYEERLEQRKQRERRDSLTTQRIVHAPHEAVVPRCTRCGGRVRQDTEALVCDCGAVTFYATPSRRDTTKRLAEMEATYRRLFVQRQFSPQGVNSSLAKVLETPQSTVDGTPGSGAVSGQSSASGLSVPPSPGFRPDTRASDGVNGSSEATPAAAAATGAVGDAPSDHDEDQDPSKLTRTPTTPKVGNRHRATSDALLRLHEHHEGKSVNM